MSDHLSVRKRPRQTSSASWTSNSSAMHRGRSRSTRRLDVGLVTWLIIRRCQAQVTSSCLEPGDLSVPAIDSAAPAASHSTRFPGSSPCLMPISPRPSTRPSKSATTSARPPRAPVREAVEAALDLLDRGEARVAEKGADGAWQVNQWLKKAVLLSFRLNDMTRDPGRPRPGRVVGQGAVQVRRLGRRPLPRRRLPRGAGLRSCAAPPISRRASC